MSIRVLARLHAPTLAIPFGRTREIPRRDLARDDARASPKRQAGSLFGHTDPSRGEHRPLLDKFLSRFLRQYERKVSGT